MCGRGDFKTIRFPEERKSGGGISASMRRMSYVIDDMRIRDIPIQGGPFTWRGGRNNCLMFRLDHFFISDDWETYFSSLVQSTLPRPFSDHCHILLDASGIRTSPSHLWFETMWLRVEGFKELLKQWWQGLNFSDSLSFILDAKLKALKGILKSWNRELFGKVEERKFEAPHIVNF